MTLLEFQEIPEERGQLVTIHVSGSQDLLQTQTIPTSTTPGPGRTTGLPVRCPGEGKCKWIGRNDQK
jgi:hypothetical protein